MGVFHISSGASEKKLSTPIGVHFSSAKPVTNTTSPKSKELIGNGQPNPYKYEIVKNIQIGPHLVLKVKYPDCTNYEGLKILLYLNTRIEQLKKQRYLDPHFNNDPKIIWPFARFEPTDRGMDAALKLALIMWQGK